MARADISPPGLSARHCVWAIAAACLLCASCSVQSNTRPDRVKNMEAAMRKSGAKDFTSHATMVEHKLGVTVSGSSSHLQGTDSLSNSPFILISSVSDSASRMPVLGIYKQKSTECRIGTSVATSMKESFEGAFAALNTDEDLSFIQTKLYMVPPYTEVLKKIVNTRIGNHIDLTYYAVCQPNHPNKSLFYALMMVMHEISHAVMRFYQDLSGLDDASVQLVRAHNEIAATGGAVCLIEEQGKRAQSPSDVLWSQDEYLKTQAEIPLDIRGSTSDWCGKWKHRLRSSINTYNKDN